MKFIWSIYLLSILSLGVLIGCQPTTSPEPENQPIQDGNDDTEANDVNNEAEADDEGGETAVPAPADSEQTDSEPLQSPSSEEDPDIIVLPAPEATADRGIRLTPGTMPSGVEIAPINEPIEPGTIEPLPESVQELLNNELQTNAGLSPNSYEIIRAEATTWNDGSLGCPQPGMMYTQAIVDGYWVVIQSGEQTLDYRITTNGLIVRCEQTLQP